MIIASDNLSAQACLGAIRFGITFTCAMVCVKCGRSAKFRQKKAKVVAKKEIAEVKAEDSQCDGQCRVCRRERCFKQQLHCSGCICFPCYAGAHEVNQLEGAASQGQREAEAVKAMVSVPWAITKPSYLSYLS